ncbi:MAG: HhoA/HhoB/HtrA family serine endopeptidase [Geitlerinemataceae cyanobacterium]
MPNPVSNQTDRRSKSLYRVASATPNSPRHGQRIATSLWLLLVGVAGCSRLAALPTASPSQPEIQVAAASEDSPKSNSDRLVPSNFVTEVVDRVGPAVVRIDTQRALSRSRSEDFNNPRRYFGQPFSEDSVPVEPEKKTQTGMGSGFILTATGRIATNAHVVEGVETVTVTLKDGRSFPGRVVGRDTVTDVAVVQIDARGLPTVTLGNSKDLQPGEWAIAIGNPLGLDNTVTTGIISATGRSSRQAGVPDKRVEFIQTDAAINPGNSGGPLLNQNGDAIAMNTAIVQGAQGLGFAIPIETVKQIADQLVAQGKVEHSYLGIKMTDLTPEVKENFNRESGLRVLEDRGVLVVEVVPNSPAAIARLRPGDTIQKIDGKVVSNADEVQQAVSQVRVGTELQLEIRRNGQTLTSGVQTEALPDNAF